MRMSMISLIFLALVIAIAVGLFLLGSKAGKKIKSNGVNNEGGEDMIKSLYVYLVLFATLMMTIGGSVGAFMATADIIAPTPYYQTFEDFKRFDMGKDFDNNTENKDKPTEEELKIRYDAMIASQRDNDIARAKNALIKSLGWIIIPLVIFIYFQRNLKASKA